MSSGVNLANVINLAGGMNFLQQQQSRFMPMMQQDKNGFAAGSGTAEQQAVQHPFSPAKGWFAYHSNGRQVQLLERLHVLLETPDMPLQKTAGKKMSDVRPCQSNRASPTGYRLRRAPIISIPHR